MADTYNDRNPAPVETVLAEFEARKEKLSSFCSRTKSLIEECLQDAGIQYQSVQARVKGSRKLRDKFLNPSKNYKKLDDITDLAALRIVTYYEDEVDRVAQVIEREFEIDRPNSIDKRQTDPDRFGYYALNYVCRHSERRRNDVEYKKYADVCCEIQITSILRHAWSEIQHGWYDLRGAFPDHIKRRFYRMAALLEIAESEFLELRKKKSDYIKSIDVQVEAQVPEVPLTSVSLRSLVFQDPAIERLNSDLAALIGYELLPDMSDKSLALLYELAERAGFKTVREIRDALIRHGRDVLEYVRRCMEFWPSPPADIKKQTERGLGIYHLSMLTICGRESQEVLTTGSGVLATQQAQAYALKQIAVAKEIMSRYSR